MGYDQALIKLEKYGQEHLLKYYDELSEEGKKQLLKQINETDFDIIRINKSEEQKSVFEPIDVVDIEEIEKNKQEFFDIGIEAIKKGKVGAVLLAGGQGTRLGCDGPKGKLNIGITKDLYIFECLINNLLDVTNLAGNYIPLFIMTSEINNDETIEFFKENNYFGYNKDYVTFFVQDMAPSVDYNGKVYMVDKDKLSLSPNGNGGWFTSLCGKKSLEEENNKNIEWLNVFAVDNVLQRMADPLFVGATIKSGYAVGSKVIKKASPDERVGVMCKRNGKPSIVEYYELTDEMRHQKNENGDYAYNYGVILNYLFRVEDLNRIVNEELPLHVVEKKIPYMDENGNTIKPEKPNGYKFELLVLDMIEMLDNSLVFEVLRNKEFAPIKNKEGVDSVETATVLLEENGVVL